MAISTANLKTKLAALETEILALNESDPVQFSDPSGLSKTRPRLTELLDAWEQIASILELRGEEDWDVRSSAIGGRQLSVHYGHTLELIRTRHRGHHG